MPDPVTIGALAATALAMAGEAVIKGTVGGVVKDTYKALKGKVAPWAVSDIEALEKAPTSVARKAVVAEIVDGQSADEKAAVHALAKELIAAMKSAGGSSVGLDIGRLEALDVQLGNITVTEGTGARIGEARVHGTFATGNITVGPGKS
jgi:hypothetical protein